jgi:hypothetical protein
MASHSMLTGSSISAGILAVPAMQPRKLLDFGSGTTRVGIMERINLQRESKAKPYQVRQVRRILANYKLL